MIIIGATNRPDIIDEALLRPGRFDRLLEVPLPDNDAIREILRIHMAKKPVDNSVDIEKLVELVKGYSGADIASLVNAAAMSAIREHITNNRSEQKTIKKEQTKSLGDNENRKFPLTISMKHFEDALKKVKRSISVANNQT